MSARFPGISCLATLTLSLRDLERKQHSNIDSVAVVVSRFDLREVPIKSVSRAQGQRFPDLVGKSDVEVQDIFAE